MDFARNLQEEIDQATQRTLTAQNPAWSDPEPLISAHGTALPYPIAALSPTIRDAVQCYQAFGQQPLPMVASTALANASLACQGLADVARDRNLSGPCSLNFLTIGVSGERKTSADRRFRRSAQFWQNAERERLRPEIDAARAKLEAWQARKDGLLNAIKKLASQDKTAAEADRRQLDMDIEHHQTIRPIVPPDIALFAEDSTAEALALDLGLGWPSSSLWSDEGGLVIGGHAMSAGSVMRFLALLNRLWDGNSFTRRRTTSGNVEIRGRRLTVSLMAQPNIVEELIGGHDGLARGIGILARFLICWPESTIGHRPYRPGNLDADELRAFDNRITALLSLPLPIEDEASMVLKPPVLDLEPAAFDVWHACHDQAEATLGRHGEYAEMTDVGAKIAEQATRIACVMHVFEHGSVGAIPAATMQAGADIAIWHLHEARRVFGLVDTDQVTLDAELLLEWLSAQKAPPTLKYLAQFAPHRLRKKDRRNDALSKLTAHSLARRETLSGSTVIVLNPAWEAKP